MGIIIILIAAIVLLFGMVVFFGAPYLPTHTEQSKTGLELLGLKQGQTLLELGCGDGKILKIAAEQGIHCVGYELNPLLVVISRARTWRHRKQVKVVWGDFWKQEWPEADGIYVFLLDKYMEKLHNKIVQESKKWRSKPVNEQKPVRLASYVFKIPGKNPNKSQQGVHLYIY